MSDTMYAVPKSKLDAIADVINLKRDTVGGMSIDDMPLNIGLIESSGGYEILSPNDAIVFTANAALDINNDISLRAISRNTSESSFLVVAEGYILDAICIVDGANFWVKIGEELIYDYNSSQITSFINVELGAGTEIHVRTNSARGNILFFGRHI